MRKFSPTMQKLAFYSIIISSFFGKPWQNKLNILFVKQQQQTTEEQKKSGGGTF